MKFSRLLLAITIPIVFLALFITSLQTKASPSATFTVNSTVDAVDVNPGDGMCETAVAGQCTLRAAVMEANANPNFDTINIPAGTFLLSIAGRGDDLGISGDLDISENIMINGSGYELTILDGNNLDRLLHILNSSNVTIANVTIQNGTALRNVSDFGGGVFNASGNVIIANSRITECEDEGVRNSGTMTITSTIVDRNMGLVAGGFHNTDNSHLTIIDSEIDSNIGGILNKLASLSVIKSSITGNYEFGGIRQDGPNNTPITIIQSKISENYNVSPGGGIGVYNGGDINIENTVIVNNTSGSAGGIHFYGNVITITSSSIDRNMAIGGGGSQGAGIQMIGGKLILTNSSVTNNQMLDLENTKGGGVYLEGGAIIENSTISTNSADLGGGLFLAGGTSNITNTTIVFNQATMGGGIYDEPSFFSPAVLVNSIIANNAAENCGGGTMGLGSEVASLGNNIESDTSCNFTSSGDLSNTDPLLGSLAWNGGVGLTLLPLPNSPAVDAGNNLNCPSTDQRGGPRPFDGDSNGTPVCDIGAVEYGSLPIYYVYLPLIVKQ